MPPLPKHQPARRNKTATKATLVRDHGVAGPPLPERPEGWQDMTRSWWADLWASPMAPEYDDSDKHGLFMLAVLVDAFWLTPSEKLASEIRMQRQCFGLTPIDRRRLQWEIEKVDEAQDKGRKRRTATAEAKPTRKRTDPRAALRAVQ